MVRSMIYKEMKPFLFTKIIQDNLHKKTLRTRKYLILFRKNGIGIDKIKLVSYSATEISKLIYLQIQNVIDQVISKTIPLGNNQNYVILKTNQTNDLPNLREFSSENFDYYGITDKTFCPLCKLNHGDEESIEVSDVVEIFEFFYHSGLQVKPQTGVGIQGLGPDRELARKWDDGYARKQDLNNKIGNFFLNPSERSNLFGEVKHDIFNETDNKKGEIIYRTEKHKRDESLIALIVTQRLISLSLDFVHSAELKLYRLMNRHLIMIIQMRTLPKVNKVAFRIAYDAISDSSKFHLSTGTVVEDVLFKFCKDMKHEHHAHSYIIDYDDEEIKALFNDVEWEELTTDAPSLSSANRKNRGRK
ncbi:hypothetical protein C1645_741827 [Glomus cerebriforme]|uniref:Uncharacterized protein n=1 Tax=Glomus cerebriforme TaxID=658196 RepID=A0A397SQK2_9GLOM|nr:hypothetical protein C1645_741827 [Glomus cerebriforme]